jgi:alpha-1,3-rhamnosyl/mannosyltransferase
VFPSLYEGFGLPVLEAMQSGVPVVCSDRASLPEVAGDAALLKGPDDLEGLAEAFLLVLDSDEYRERLILTANQQTKQFTWQRCTTEAISVYQQLIR